MRRTGPRVAAVLGLVAAVLAVVACARVTSFENEDSARIRIESDLPGIELVHTPGLGAAWTPDGRLIAYASRSGIEFEHPDGRRAGRLRAPAYDYEFTYPTPIRFSADARRLFYVTNQGPGRGVAVRATEVEREGGAVRQDSLGTSLADASFGVHGWPLVYATGRWSPDGNGTFRGPPPAIWKVAGPGAPPRRLRSVDGSAYRPVVGERDILFKVWRRGGTELWAMGLDGSAPHRLARFLFLPQYEFGPDGRSVAFAALPADHRLETRLYVVDTERGRPRWIGGIDDLRDGPIWSPDGRWLVFSTRGGEIRRIHPDGRGSQTIAAAPGEVIDSLAFSPDGHRLLYGARPAPSEAEYGD